MNLTRNKSNPILSNTSATKILKKQSSYSLFSNIIKSSFKQAIESPSLTVKTSKISKTYVKPSKAKSTEDFNFLFKDDIQISNKSNINEYEMIRKLSVWDKNNLKINPTLGNNNLKMYMYPKREAISTKSVFDQGQLLKSHRKNNIFQIKDLFDTKNQDKHTLCYAPKSTFDYTAFTHQSNKIDLKSIPTIDKINHELYHGTYYHQYLLEKKRNETNSRKHLMEMYYKIVIHNFKKEKCEGILNDIYKLLEEAREEYSMITNILKDKMKKNEEEYKIAIAELIEYQAKINKARISLPLVTNNGQPMTIQTIEDKDKKNNKSINEEDNESQLSCDTITITITSTKNISNTLLINKRRTHISRDSIHDKLRLYIDFIAINDTYKEKIQESNNEFTEIKKELTELINENKNVLEKINRSLLHLRTQFESQSKKQRAYYSTKLKQGIDTRNEGLTWIVKRLLELNVKIDSSYFPTYLDADQIEYLLRRSHLEHEAYKLRSLLKTIKIRKQTLLNEDNFKRLEQFASIPIELKVSTNLLEFKKEKSTQALRNYMCSRFKSIYEKHEGLLNKNKEQMLEEVQIKHIICTINKKINQYALYGNSLFDNNLEEVKEYLKEHQSQREYYNDIKELRKRLEEIEKEIMNIREDEEEMFKRKYHLVKTRQEGDKANVYYENVYNALFGTTVISH